MLLFGAALLLIALTLLARSTDVLSGLELRTVDTRFSERGSLPAPRDIVVVEIDDGTFNHLGELFPFPRGYYARVIDRLVVDGARTIAVDIQFTEPSGRPQQDDELIESVRDADNVVLATTEVGAGGSTRIFGGGSGLAYSRATPADSNLPNDPGGVIRRMSLSISGLTTFPLATAERFLGHRVAVPADAGATPWIDFHGPPGTLVRIPFWRLYDGSFPADLVRGKIVVVGASAASLGDLHATSTTGLDLMPGPEIQAEATATVLDGFPLRSTPGWIDVALVVVLGFAMPVLAQRLRALLALVAGATLLVLFAVGAQVAFDRGWIVQVTYPLAAGLLTLGSTAALLGVSAAYERERVRDVFSRFVPESVVGEVLDAADGARLGGVRRQGTVMFSDLRGFTSFAENLEPDGVIEILNRYLTEMSDAILDHGGTLVSYMGDGIMAVFGAPIEQPDHAGRALAAARAMLERLQQFNSWLRDEGLGEGFRMGIGLNSGPVMSGNVGSERRLEYTAIGDTTNTAARLEGMTKGTPHQLFVADTTRRLLDADAGLVEVGEHEVRGREGRVRLWTVADEPSAPSTATPTSGS